MNSYIEQNNFFTKKYNPFGLNVEFLTAERVKKSRLNIGPSQQLLYYCCSLED